MTSAGADTLSEGYSQSCHHPLPIPPHSTPAQDQNSQQQLHLSYKVGLLSKGPQLYPESHEVFCEDLSQQTQFSNLQSWKKREQGQEDAVQSSQHSLERKIPVWAI